MVCAPHEKVQNQRKLTDWERSVLISVQTNEGKDFADFFRLLLLASSPMKTYGEVEAFLNSAHESFAEGVPPGTPA